MARYGACFFVSCSSEPKSLAVPQIVCMTTCKFDCSEFRFCADEEGCAAVNLFHNLLFSHVDAKKPFQAE